jgi:putative glycosyltransferase (TIGR04372 family)|tara:strand:+ start:8566 stop:9867 length:1302 start_codon:yes stop_codon:yes gene_type:complete
MSLFYKLFKPINPVEWDGRKTYEYNLKNKYSIFFKEIKSPKKDIQKLFIKLLTLLKETIVFLLTIIYLPISIILYFLNFRFLHINTWQICAYIEQMDTIIKYNLLYQNKKIIFLCPKFILINTFIHKIYNQKLKCIENFFLYLILYPLMHTKFLAFNAWNFETINPESKFNQLHLDYYKKFKNYSIDLSELKNEKNLLNEFCNENNIKSINKLIVIQQRDQFYYNSPATRNANIKNFNKTVSFLIDSGFDVVRYKSKESEKLEIKSKNYHELNLSSEKDKLKQFVICKNCRLVVCYQGGVMAYNQIFNTQFLVVNAIPINRNVLIKPQDRIILKKCFSKKLNQFLSIDMIVSEKLHLYVDTHTLREKEIVLYENDEEEILEAVKETLKINDNSLISNSQEKFRDMLSDEITFKHSPSLVCNSFLKKNSFLIKP